MKIKKTYGFHTKYTILDDKDDILAVIYTSYNIGYKLYMYTQGKEDDSYTLLGKDLSDREMIPLAMKVIRKKLYIRAQKIMETLTSELTIANDSKTIYWKGEK